MSTDSSPQSYPIVETKPLAAPTTQWKILKKRDRSELPIALPHHIWVFNVDGELRPLKPQQFTGREPELINATSVSVVDFTQNRVISVQVELPSSDPADGFSLTAWFSCSVTDPAMVVEHGIADVAQALKAQLQSYPAVTQLAMDYEPRAIDEVRRIANATVEAVKVHSPFGAPGMAIALISCDLRVSSEVAQHARDRSSVIRTEELSWLQLQERHKLEQLRIEQEQHIRRQGDEAIRAARYGAMAGEVSLAELARNDLDRDREDSLRREAQTRDDLARLRHLEDRDYEYRIVREREDRERQLDMVKSLSESGVLRELSPSAMQQLLGTLGVDPGLWGAVKSIDSGGQTTSGEVAGKSDVLHSESVEFIDEDEV